MKWFRIGDTVHPDTLNLLLEAAGLSEVSELVLHHPDTANGPDGWVVIVPDPGGGLVLRRLRRAGDGWRHYPMTEWSPGVAADDERDGAPVAVPPLDQVPTWRCDAALAAAPRLGSQLAHLGKCLEAIAFLPRYARLAEMSAGIDCVVAAGNRPSRDLADLLFAAHRAFAPDPPRPPDRPSAADLLRAAADVIVAVGRTDLEIGPPERITDDWVAGCVRLFDPTQSRVFAGDHATAIDQRRHWLGKTGARLIPRLVPA